jgi:hypothetical protein
MNSDLVDIPGEVLHETDKAYLFDDGRVQVWLPISQCEWDEYEKTMAVPEWLATVKGLT